MPSSDLMFTCPVPAYLQGSVQEKRKEVRTSDYVCLLCCHSTLWSLLPGPEQEVGSYLPGL